MSRASTAPARPLSLTEELEKLEQSITLTLQEIDHNFSRAHRIVTSSILPIVEQYAEHSSAVWEGSKFWKQFFEASANVSLSGVEEREEEEEISYEQLHDNASAYETTASHRDDESTFQTTRHDTYADDSILDNGDISGSTPRAPRPESAIAREQFADYGSPYESLKKEMKGSETSEDEDAQILPTTPGTKSRIPDMSMTPGSSPFDPTTYLQQASKRNLNADPLLHRVLDKNYRVQATPHKTAHKEHKTPVNKPSWQDTSSPMSSPLAIPQLNATLFSSPVRKQYNQPMPRTPGISVNPSPVKRKERETYPKPGKKDEISWESDSDDDADDVYKELGMSPPKTIQFSLPQTRLLQTPAREASKKIVEDLLHTAGAFDDSEDLNSPSVVVRQDALDDSF